MQYDACVVPGISWSFDKRLSFNRFIVSLSFYRFRYRYTEIVSVRYVLSYRFQTITPKRSVRYPFHYFLVHVSDYPNIDSAQITLFTYKRESIVSCLQALEMIPIRQLLNLALPPWGREGHFFPSYMYVYVSVRYSLLDDTECRGPVYCIAHTMITRSILPVGIRYTKEFVRGACA